MKYEIRYKCTYIPGWTQFPVLKIRYRRSESWIWSKLEKDLDWYLEKMEFYGIDVAGFLEFMDTEKRANMFQIALTERFDGSMTNYVKKIVEDIVVHENKKQQESNYVAELIDGWTTNGWETIEFNIAE